MSEWISQFHFLRPFWLWMILPCAVVVSLLWQQYSPKGSWQKVIAPQLLQHLLQDKQQQAGRWPLVILMSSWVVGCLALAGPAWEKQPTPVSKSLHPLIVAVDMSYNLFASDITPNRLTRTRYKLQDLYKLRSDGVTAIVAYAGSAHTVAPLTDDSRTLANLTKAMVPTIMPVQGNEPQTAIRQALELLSQGSSGSGDILLVTGSVTDAQANEINKLLKDSPARLSVLGIGTHQGAPIPLPEGGYLKDTQGTILVPQLDEERLGRLARKNHGQYRALTVDDSDIRALIPRVQINDPTRTVERDFDQWQDAGAWLVLLLLPAALLGFRRGWLILLLVATLPVTQDAKAFGWKDLWQTRDQQAQQALQQGDPKKAAELFDNPDWKAQSLYQGQQYEEAAKAFGRAGDINDSAKNDYNHGNALAKAGKLKEALEAYNKALKKDPKLSDAQFNRNRVEQLLKQQQQQQQKNQQDPKNQDSQNQEKQNQQNPDQQDQAKGDDQNRGQQQSNGQQPPSSDNPQQQTEGSEEQQSPEQPSDHSSEQQQQAANQQEKKPGEHQDQQQSSAQKHDKTQPEDTSRQQNLEKQQAGSDSQEHSQPLSPEKQAVESWLRTIPDDPGGLLRRKFLQQQQQQQKAGQG